MTHQLEQKQASTAVGLFSDSDVQKEFKKVLGNTYQVFLSSVLQVVGNSKHLKSANPATVMTAAMTAAILNLPIDPNLGYAYIIPFKGQAQFQIGTKGLVQLGIRSGLFKSINHYEVHKNQFISFDYRDGVLRGNFSEKGNGEIVGYGANFVLHDGFIKEIYWSMEEVKEHGKKYSQSFADARSPWVKEFDKMALKTVLKTLLRRWAPLSFGLQLAVKADSSVQQKRGEYIYTDGKTEILTEDQLQQAEVNAALEEWKMIINTCNTIPDFEEKVKQIKGLGAGLFSDSVKSCFIEKMGEKGFKFKNKVIVSI